MVDTCLIQRRTGETTDDDGNVTPTFVTVYSGKCKVHQQSVQARAADPGEAYVLMVRRELHLPVATSGGIRAGNEVTIIVSANAPDLVGRVLVVRDEAAKSAATARRLGVEERTS